VVVYGDVCCGACVSCNGDLEDCVSALASKWGPASKTDEAQQHSSRLRPSARPPACLPGCWLSAGRPPALVGDEEEEEAAQRRGGPAQ